MAEDGEVNLEEILNDICSQIVNIYRKSMNPHADINTRKPLDLLTEIESTIEHAMQEIQHIEALDQVEVLKEEKARKHDYKSKLRAENQRLESMANEAKNAELKARMDRVVEKVGKPAMGRSTKKRVKKEVKEVKVDEERMDFIRYLGEDMA
jgi:hypothetical protein